METDRNMGWPNPGWHRDQPGIDPLSVTNLLEEYTNHVYRRIVRITSIASITPPNETNLGEEQTIHEIALTTTGTAGPSHGRCS